MSTKIHITFNDNKDLITLINDDESINNDFQQSQFLFCIIEDINGNIFLINKNNVRDILCFDDWSGNPPICNPENIICYKNAKIDNQDLSAKWCETYKNETIGGIGIVIDSWGMASLFLSNGNAQKMLNCKDNSKVIIKVSN